MTDFDPDVPVKRQVLDVLVGKHIHVRHVTSDLSQAKGYLTWDATQPEHTLIRAIQFGLAMVRTDCTDEWVVAGSGVFALIRTMDDFVELDRPEIACGLTYAGNIRNMRVYLLPWPAMPAIEILIGHGDEFARCVCTDFPVGFGGERPPEMIDPNANNRGERPPEMIDPNANNREELDCNVYGEDCDDMGEIPEDEQESEIILPDPKTLVEGLPLWKANWEKLEAQEAATEDCWNDHPPF